MSVTKVIPQQERLKRKISIRAKARKYKSVHDIKHVLPGSILKNYRRLFENNNRIVESAHKGIAISAIADFGKLSDKSQKEIAALIHTTTKTLQNYSASSKKLPTLQTELLLKLYALYDKGIEVFGKKEAFNKWLQKPAFGLYNQVPDNLLSTSTGINLVMDELIRIEYGEFA